MNNFEANQQEAIETACRNALKAQQQSLDPVVGLAAALEAIEWERTHSSGLPFTYCDLIARLRCMAAPWRWREEL